MEIVAGPVRRASEVVEGRALRARSFIGPRFDAWFFRACARRPQQRFATAVEQIRSLADALQE